MPRLSLRHAASVLAIALLFTGCATNGGDYDKPADTVSGFYDGHWYGPDPEKPLGTLNCTVTPAGGDKWNAHFVATFGETGEYDVDLRGVRDGDRVVFGGNEDLGEDQGGMFKWTGQISGDAFTGNYAASTYKGTFRMERAEAPAE